MLKKLVLTTISAILALFVVVVYISAVEKEAIKKPKHTYVGVKKCGMCHRSSKRGDQYGKWKKFKHAKAFLNLKTPEAKEVAQEEGVKENPWESPKCLKCHVTAFKVKVKFPEFIGERFKIEDGVQCEACHGPGSDYSKLSIMKDEKKAIEHGLKMPNEKDEMGDNPKKWICKKCHNSESPTYKEFDFKKLYKKIAHPIPKEEKEE